MSWWVIMCSVFCVSGGGGPETPEISNSTSAATWTDPVEAMNEAKPWRLVTEQEQVSSFIFNNGTFQESISNVFFCTNLKIMLNMSLRKWHTEIKSISPLLQVFCHGNVACCHCNCWTDKKICAQLSCRHHMLYAQLKFNYTMNKLGLSLTMEHVWHIDFVFTLDAHHDATWLVLVVNLWPSVDKSNNLPLSHQAGQKLNYTVRFMQRDTRLIICFLVRFSWDHMTLHCF